MLVIATLLAFVVDGDLAVNEMKVNDSISSVRRALGKPDREQPFFLGKGDVSVTFSGTYPKDLRVHRVTGTSLVGGGTLLVESGMRADEVLRRLGEPDSGSASLRYYGVETSCIIKLDEERRVVWVRLKSNKEQEFDVGLGPLQRLKGWFLGW